MLLLLFLRVWTVDHFLLDQIRYADGDRVGLVVAGVIMLADKLIQRLRDFFLLGVVVVCYKFLNSLWGDIDKLLITKSPGIQIGHADNLAENLYRLAGCRDIQQCAFTDNGCVRMIGEQTPKFGRDLGQLLSVALLLPGVGGLVVDITCLLHGCFALLRIIPQDRKARALHGEVACDNIH